MKKILSLFLCVVAVLILASCVGNSADKTEDSKEPYKELIEHYQWLIEQKLNDKSLTESSHLRHEINAPLIELVEQCEDPAALGHATKDINRDGIPELVLLNKSNRLHALFTLENNAPVMLELAYRKGELLLIVPDGTVYFASYVEGERDDTAVRRLVNGKLQGLQYGVSKDEESYYKIEDGVRSTITRAEKLALDESIQSLLIRPFYETKTTGFRFVPAVPDSSGASEAPLADFSSYDSILSAYKTIVENFSEYTRETWANGEFDNLFSFADNENYDIFHAIFYGGIRVMPTKTYWGTEYDEDGDNAYGYAKKDLNGDGIEELILMNDQYEIFAVFTMKNGKAVLLGDLYHADIGSDGRIYVERETGGIVSRDGEVFLYEVADGALNCLVGVGYQVNWELKQEGWYKIENGIHISISDEEGEALYAQYDHFLSGYIGEEYTRTFAGLAFVPLFEHAVASEEHINTYGTSGVVGGRSLSLSAVSEETVTFTLECMKTVGEFDPVTNPDPEVQVATITGDAVRDGNVYRFEKDGVTGYIEFAVNAAWVVITDSQQEPIACRAYLFNYPDSGLLS